MTQKVKLQPYSNQVNFQPRVASDLRDKTITDQLMHVPNDDTKLSLP